jgi:hypothetical protein
MRTVWALSLFPISLLAGSNPVTYSKHLAPVLYKHCAGCHRPGDVAPFSVLTYQETRPWAAAIRQAVAKRTMPPWHADPKHGKFVNDSRLTDAEIALVASWAQQGAKEGNPADLPPAPVFEPGWRIGKPDAVFAIPEFTLSDTGYDEQQTFVVETNFSEDKWVEAVELKPGNRKVVHHAHVWIEPRASAAAPQANAGAPRPKRVSYTLREGTRAYARPDAPVIDDGCGHPDGGMWPGSKPDELASMLGSFVPGKDPEVWPAGIAKRIPAGARLKFTIHYSKTTRQVETDATSVGLRFSKQPPERELRRIDLHNLAFLIPPNAGNHPVTACYTFPEDADVLSYVAHMHFRGRSMRFEATYPDGRTDILLDIPKYDFDWQTKYINAAPVRLPKGTRLRLSATFDNSPNNPKNPDPSKTIRWGDNTVDEMMDGWLEFVSPRP